MEGRRHGPHGPGGAARDLEPDAQRPPIFSARLRSPGYELEAGPGGLALSKCDCRAPLPTRTNAAQLAHHETRPHEPWGREHMGNG